MGIRRNRIMFPHKFWQSATVTRTAIYLREVPDAVDNAITKRKGRNQEEWLALVAASIVTVAADIRAQKATRREAPPGNPTVDSTLNGIPVGGTQSDASDRGTNGQTNLRSMTHGQTCAYVDARNACLAQPADQRSARDDAANQRFTSVDPKCQKLSGPALAGRLHGADR
jgi:hypothetical protein